MANSLQLKKIHANIVRNLKELLYQNDITATQLSREINTPQSTIQNIIIGRTLDPRISTAEKICKHFGVAFEDLISSSKPSISAPNSAKIQKVPVINWQNAVNANKYIKNLNPQSVDKWLICDHKIAANAFALCTKRYLEPRFQAGSYLIIDPSHAPTDHNMVIVHFKGSPEATIREYIIDGTKPLLKPITPEKSAVNLTSSVKIIGTVYQSRFDCS